jgi:release factor glutamine methyltransferase
MMSSPSCKLDTLLRYGAQCLRDAGIVQPYLESQMLMEAASGMSRLQVLSHPEFELQQGIAGRFHELIKQRCNHYPMAYIRGYQEFYGLKFNVNPHTLIPRPETELLVDQVRQFFAVSPDGYLGDAGAGSGCISVASLVYVPSLQVIASDISMNALFMARANARMHGVDDRIQFVRMDFLEGYKEHSLDMLVSNPPYINTDEIEYLQPEVSKYEPRIALDGDADGLGCIRNVISGSKRALKSGGRLAIEVGVGQASAVIDLMKRSGLRECSPVLDLSGIERVVTGVRM